jgi:PAS domain-containing protein
MNEQPDESKRPDPLEAMRVHGSSPKTREWEDIRPDEMAAEMLTRGGRFQIMVSFMRISPMAALVIDGANRVVFMNAAAERYWKVRQWDVRGTMLAEIMHLCEADEKGLAAEHRGVLRESPSCGAQVFYEHFRNGSERMSMLKFTFCEDEDYKLIGCFVLPSIGSI